MDSREIINLAVDAASLDPSFTKVFNRRRKVLVVNDNVLRQTLPGLNDEERQTLISTLATWAESARITSGFVKYDPRGFIEIVSSDPAEVKTIENRAMNIIRKFAVNAQTTDMLGISRAQSITEGFEHLDESRAATLSFEEEIARVRQTYMSNLQEVLGEEGIDVRAAFSAATTVSKFAGSLSISLVPISVDKANRRAMSQLRHSLASELREKSHEMLKGQRKASLDNITSRIIKRRKFKPVSESVKFSRFLEPRPRAVKFRGPDKTSYEETESLLSLTNLINENLHDYVQDKMGKGGASQILNYQTGRFARSAELLNLVRGQDNHLTATITYMRSPYDVFRPGGQLYKPGRDPKRIIGSAMRSMIKHQFLKNQSVALSTILG